MTLENTWTWADIVQLLVGVILFMVGTWIGKNQEKSIKLIRNSVNLTKDLSQEIKYLQTGLSELEMSEKIGVIGWGLNRVSQKEAGAAPALLYDCLAVLPILEFSGEPLANKYANLLLKSLELLTEHYSIDRNPMAAILIADLLKAIEKLKSRGRQEIAEDMTGALARYLDTVKSKDKQKAEEICSHLFPKETLKLFFNLETGDIPKIMKLLASCHQVN